MIVHIYKHSKGFRGTESISNNSAITVTAIQCNYNNSNQFAKSLLTLQQIASLIVCQQNTKILYNLPALHTCALNGVDGLEEGLTATKWDDHALVNIKLHPVHSAPVADVSRERCRTLQSSITISLSVVRKQMKITDKSLFDIVHENINEVRSKKKNLRDPRDDLKRIRATLSSTS